MTESERLANALEVTAWMWRSHSAEVYVLRAIAELRRLQAECDALQADAERYRFIRTHATATDLMDAWADRESARAHQKNGPEAFDATIDAARKA